MQWMISLDKLSAEQRDVINSTSQSNTPKWIQGHAGSGKSVVLLYALNDYVIRNRKAKVAVVVFTHALKDLLENGINQLPSLVIANIEVMTIYQMNKKLEELQIFDAIFCDEVQDLPLDFITALSKSSQLFVMAGDAMQSIYTKDPQFSKDTVNPQEITDHIKPDEYQLNTVFRLSQNVLNMLKKVFQNLSSKAFVGKENTDIRRLEASNLEDEVRWVWEETQNIRKTRPSDAQAILMFRREDIISFVNHVLTLEGKPTWEVEEKERFNKKITDFDSLNKHLKTHNLPLMYVGNKHGSLKTADEHNKIILMTYHSAKGLDFDAVFLPFAHTSFNFIPTCDELALVALSRSKRDLTITYTEHLSLIFRRFLRTIPQKNITFSEKDSESDEILF